MWLWAGGSAAGLDGPLLEDPRYVLQPRMARFVAVPSTRPWSLSRASPQLPYFDICVANIPYNIS